MDIKYWYIRYSFTSNANKIIEDADVIDIHPMDWINETNKAYSHLGRYRLHYSLVITKDQYNEYNNIWNE